MDPISFFGRFPLSVTRFEPIQTRLFRGMEHLELADTVRVVAGEQALQNVLRTLMAVVFEFGVVREMYEAHRESRPQCSGRAAANWSAAWDGLTHALRG